MASRSEPRWELFAHDADIGVRGVGPTREAAFEQVALALTAVITDPKRVRTQEQASVRCDAPDVETLLVDWLNELVFLTATRHLLFGRFDVRIEGTHLDAEAWGEPIDTERHRPAAEPKGATYTAARVARDERGEWTAQCVVDV
jgi:tRNA nucleotidyltransferase (CCA-adding enzyme)